MKPRFASSPAGTVSVSTSFIATWQGIYPVLTSPSDPCTGLPFHTSYRISVNTPFCKSAFLSLGHLGQACLNSLIGALFDFCSFLRLADALPRPGAQQQPVCGSRWRTRMRWTCCTAHSLGRDSCPRYVNILGQANAVWDR